jgi:dGTP triphosphohydrolase
MLSNMQINRLLASIKQSKEYLSLMNKTQVLNDRKLEYTSTRGSHTNEVADISKRIVEALVDAGIETDAEGKKVNPKLAELMGIAHDLGHTPYGHNGEAKINNCLESLEASEEYLTKRRENFGNEYEDEQQAKFEKENANDPDKKRTMQFEHNEHSAEVFLKICDEQGIDRSEVSDIVTGILAHSTSRVKNLPKGVEQQAVRLADKIAYINRDIDDMLNEKILTLEDIPEDLRDFAQMTPEERVSLCIKDVVDEYSREGIISGGSRELAEIKNLKGQILNAGKDIAKTTGKENEIISKLLETLPEKKKAELLKKWQAKGPKKAIDDVLKTAKKEDRIEILGQYNPEAVKGIVEKEDSIKYIRKEMSEKYPTMEKCYRLKDATDSAIFEKDENGIARIGNDVEKTQNEIGTLYNYYMKHSDEIPHSVLQEYPGYTQEEQAAFYIAGLNNITIQIAYRTLIETHPELIQSTTDNNEQPKIGIEQNEITPTNDVLIEKIGDEINFEENQVTEERTFNNESRISNKLPVIAQNFMAIAKHIARTRIFRTVSETLGQIESGIGKTKNPKNIDQDTQEK